MPLTFGLHRYAVPASVVEELRRVTRGKSLDEAVEILLDTPGPQVLPYLRGNTAALPRVRERYLALLSAAFSRKDLRTTLRRELQALVKPPADGRVAPDTPGDDDIGIAGRSIDCEDSWMPTFLCEWLNEPPDPPPPDDEWPPEDEFPPDAGDDPVNDCPRCMECSPFGPGIPEDSFQCWDVECEDTPDECRLPTS